MMIRILFILLALSVPVALTAQVFFEPPINNQGINFDDTNVGAATESRFVVVANPPNDVVQGVRLQENSDVFSVNPEQFNIEAGARQEVVVTFRPNEAREYNATLVIEGGAPLGRVWRYEVVMTGRGIQNRPVIRGVPGQIRFEVENWDEVNEVMIHLTNEGNALLTLAFREIQVEWLSVDPMAGQVEEGSDIDIMISTTDNLPEENGEYGTTLILDTNDPDARRIEIVVTLALNLPRVGVQRISLERGWNLISFNRDPTEQYLMNGQPSIQRLFADIVDRVLLIKDGRGNFTAPVANFWGLQYWNTAEGYWVKVSEDVELEFEGNEIPYDRTIELRTNWNTIAYYPNWRYEFLRQALEDLTDRDLLLIAKDGHGRFTVPGIGFDSPGISPGDGLMVKVTQDCEFRYSPQR